MTRRARTRRALRLALAFTLLALSTACTVFRDRDPDDGGGGPPVVVDPELAGTVDLLVLVELEPSSASLADSYGQIAGSVESALAAELVEVRRRAIAPLHARVGTSVPLLSESTGELASVVVDYSVGDGAAFLRDTAEGDYANLLALGPELDTAPLYGRETGEGEAHFEPPADGLVVLVLGALRARCGGAGCDRSADDVAAQLTAPRADGGDARWLELPGGTGLPPVRIFHVAITSPEVGDSHGALVEACRARPNFPTAALDFMEPSPVYHSQVAAAIAQGGGRARWIDFCAALSSEANGITTALAREIAGSLRP